MATKNATYRIYNGTAWEDVYFKTSAAQVGESTTLKFLRPSTHTVNGKSFFDASGNAQSITLSGDDILYDEGSTINNEIGSISGSVGNILKEYIKSISSSSDADKITLTWTKQDGSTASVDIPKSISDATDTTSGLMSATDKSHLDTMYNVWAADDNTNNLVNKVQEVLAAFNSFKEGDTIVSLLAKKADDDVVQDTFDDVNLRISGLTTTVQTLGTQKADAADVYTTTQIDTKLQGINGEINAIKNKTYRQIFEGSTAPSGMVTGDIWIYY